MTSPGLTFLLTLGVLLMASGTLAFEFNLPPPWTWTCEKNRTSALCVKSKVEAIGATKYSTLEGCKLTCGDLGGLWPKPISATIGNELAYFSITSIKKEFIHSPEDTLLLEQAYQLFLETLKKYNPDYLSEGDSSSAQCGATKTARDELPPQNDVIINVEILATKPRLTLDTADEEYSLTVTTVNDQTTVKIIGNTFFGARHGLETLSQLVDYDDSKDSLMMVDTAAITDKPAFPYRGILLDTARNFFSVKSIERVLDGMSYNKLNTFHWHISDSNSFPYVSKKLPKMAYYGAHTSRQVYTAADVKHLVEYGRVRGVRVMPELDAPAHLGNGWQWGPEEGLGELTACFDKEPWQSFCYQPPCGQLNIANENIYPVMEKIYEDMAEDFGPLDLFHYGGDEVNLNCWNTTQDIVDWMLQKNNSLTNDDYYREWGVFQDKAYNAFTRANGNREISGIIRTSDLTKKDHVDLYLDRNKYIIQFWSTSEDPLIAELLQKNFRIIFNNHDAWFFDCGFGAWVGDGHNWCSPYNSWQKVYDNNPIKIAQNLTGNTANLDLILGGEASLWSEEMDEQNMEPKLWPRGAALAERLWSNPDHGWQTAEYRMINHRQRLVKRGLLAERLQPQWCYQNEGRCYINKAENSTLLI